MRGPFLFSFPRWGALQREFFYGLARPLHLNLLYFYGIFRLGTFKPLLDNSVLKSAEQDMFGRTQFCENISRVQFPF